MPYFIKIILSAIIIASASELGRRLTPIAAILASLPLISILAMSWLYYDTKSVEKVIDLSMGIFWVIPPSLVFFLVLPLFLKNGFRFLVAMTASCVIMFLSYSLYIFILSKLGIKI